VERWWKRRVKGTARKAVEEKGGLKREHKKGIQIKKPGKKKEKKGSDRQTDRS